MIAPTGTVTAILLRPLESMLESQSSAENVCRLAWLLLPPDEREVPPPAARDSNQTFHEYTPQNAATFDSLDCLCCTTAAKTF